MGEFKVEGSGGYVIAELTEEQARKADLGVGKLFFTYLHFFFRKKTDVLL